MKNRIISIIQNTIEPEKSYLNYATKLAKDYDMPLELFARSPRLHNTPVFHTTGDNNYIPTTKIVQEKALNYRTNQLSNISDKLKSEYKNIFWNVQLGSVQESFKKIKDKVAVSLTLINQLNSDSLFNEWFGTLETELIKDSDKPVLLIPKNKSYKKPEKILLIVKDLPSLPLKQIQKLKNNFDLKISYAFVQEGEEIGLQDIMNLLDKDFTKFIGTINKFSMKYSGNHLDNILKREKPDWLSFINFDRQFFDRLTKPNTNKLLLSSDLPCLAF